MRSPGLQESHLGLSVHELAEKLHLGRQEGDRTYVEKASLPRVLVPVETVGNATIVEVNSVQLEKVEVLPGRGRVVTGPVVYFLYGLDPGGLLLELTTGSRDGMGGSASWSLERVCRS